MKIRRWIIVAGTLVLALALTAGVVSAQGPNSGRRGGPRGDRQGRAVRIGYNLLELAAQEIGIEPQELAQQLREGMTPAEVIEANGGDVAAVTEAVIAAAQARIDEAVANGNLSEENAVRLMEQINSHIDDLMNREFGLAGRSILRDRLRGRFSMELRDAIIQATGLDAAAIREGLAEGMTPAEIIEVNGGDVDAVVEAVVAAVTERVETAVSEGNLSEAAATRLLAELEERVTEWLNSVHSLGPCFDNRQGTTGGSV
jgi:ribosomal protein S20